MTERERWWWRIDENSQGDAEPTHANVFWDRMTMQRYNWSRRRRDAHLEFQRSMGWPAFMEKIDGRTSQATVTR